MPPAARDRTGGPASCFVLHHMGFFVPRPLRAGRWALTPPFHPCRTPLDAAPGGFIFCDTFRRPRLGPRGRPRVLRGMSPCGVRTFLPAHAGRSSALRTTKLAPIQTLDKPESPKDCKDAAPRTRPSAGSAYSIAARSGNPSTRCRIATPRSPERHGPAAHRS